MSAPASWTPPGPAGGASVAWTGAPAPGFPPARRGGADVGAVLRLVSAGLLLVTAALTALAPFLTLFGRTTWTGDRLSATGWADETATRDEVILFGVPLVVVAALVLAAAGLGAVAHRLPRRRPAALGCTALAVGALVAVAGPTVGFVLDLVAVLNSSAEGSAEVAQTGAGVVLMMMALVVGPTALACSVVAAFVDRPAAGREGTR